MGTWGRARLLPWEGMNEETKASLRGFLRSTVPSPPKHQGRVQNTAFCSSPPQLPPASSEAMCPSQDKTLPEAGLGLAPPVSLALLLICLSHSDAAHLSLEGIFLKVQILRFLLCRHVVPLSQRQGLGWSYSSHPTQPLPARTHMRSRAGIP